MILTGTPILLSTGKVKPVEKLRPGDVLRSHTGAETQLREMIPLRSKKNILVVLTSQHFVVMHHDQPVLTTYGWMRTRMLRIGDHLATFQQSGGGVASLLWTDTKRDWEGRLAKVDFRTLNVPPWPSPSIGKTARRAEVARAHPRPLLPDSYKKWAQLVARQRASGLTIGGFLEAEKLPHSVGYFANWASKLRKLEEEGGSSQPGFDLLCDGGFVVPVAGAKAPLFIICRDATKYAKEEAAPQEEEDEELMDEDEEPSEPPPRRASSAAPSTSSARTNVTGRPASSSKTVPASHGELRKLPPSRSASASPARPSVSYSRQSHATT